MKIFEERTRMAISNGTDLIQRLDVPAVAAPMLLVSGPELVAAACRAGIVGSFPTANCREDGELDQWLTDIAASSAGAAGFPAPNLILHPSNERLSADVATLLEHAPPVVITSVGNPEPWVAPLHEAGIQVWSDVASVRHVDKAVAAGVDGLILLSAGAGGQTGWANPLSFARAARRRFDGVIVLAGGLGDGASILAAQALGCDLAYMGSRFIATNESRADPEHRAMIVRGELDDVHLTNVLSGRPGNMLSESLTAAGLDLADCGLHNPPPPPDRTRSLSSTGAKRWRDIWSAGHSISTIDEIRPVTDVVDELRREWIAARDALV